MLPNSCCYSQEKASLVKEIMDNEVTGPNFV